MNETSKAVFSAPGLTLPGQGNRDKNEKLH